MKRLRDYQRDALRYTFSVTHPALFMEMRLGKTLTAIRRIKTYADCCHILVVGPYSTLAGWQEELSSESERWIALIGTRQQRLNKFTCFQQNYPFRMWALINKEGWMSLPEIGGHRWDVVIVDESVILKNPQAQITQFFLTHFRSAKHRWILCGTPAPESPLDYYCQLRFLDPKILKEYRNYWHFRNELFTVSDRTQEWSIKPEGKQYLSYYLSRACFFLTRSQVKMGGIKIRERRMIELPAQLSAAYRQTEKEFILEIDGVEHGRTIFSSQKYLWLRRLCGGFVNEQFQSFHKAKELLNLLTGELKGQQAIIWCQYIDEILGLKAYLKQHGIRCEYLYGNVHPAQRDKFRRQFQDGKIDHLIIQPETMKFGANLSAASVMIYYSTPEGAMTRDQSEDRAIDLCSSDNVLIIDLICTDTIEEDILMNLIFKKAGSEGIRMMVKAIQQRNN